MLRQLTAEEFVAGKPDLADDGRWHELIAGQVCSLDPPTPEHGTAVLNFSKALAEYIQQTRVGYACFELGLVVARRPDTVYCPPVSYFTQGARFAEADKEITETVPTLIFEIADTRRRREQMSRRIAAYLDWGVEAVWVADPKSLRLRVCHRAQPTRDLSDEDVLTGSAGTSTEPAVLPGFHVSVADLFREPDWWRS